VCKGGKINRLALYARLGDGTRNKKDILLVSFFFFRVMEYRYPYLSKTELNLVDEEKLKQEQDFIFGSESQWDYTTEDEIRVEGPFYAAHLALAALENEANTDPEFAMDRAKLLSRVLIEYLNTRPEGETMQHYLHRFWIFHRPEEWEPEHLYAVRRRKLAHLYQALATHTDQRRHSTTRKSGTLSSALWWSAALVGDITVNPIRRIFWGGGGDDADPSARAIENAWEIHLELLRTIPSAQTMFRLFAAHERDKPLVVQQFEVLASSCDAYCAITPYDTYHRVKYGILYYRDIVVSWLDAREFYRRAVDMLLETRRACPDKSAAAQGVGALIKQRLLHLQSLVTLWTHIATGCVLEARRSLDFALHARCLAQSMAYLCVASECQRMLSSALNKWSYADVHGEFVDTGHILDQAKHAVLHETKLYRMAMRAYLETLKSSEFRVLVEQTMADMYEGLNVREYTITEEARAIAPAVQSDSEIFLKKAHFPLVSSSEFDAWHAKLRSQTEALIGDRQWLVQQADYVLRHRGAVDVSVLNYARSSATQLIRLFKLQYSVFNGLVPEQVVPIIEAHRAVWALPIINESHMSSIETKIDAFFLHALGEPQQELTTRVPEHQEEEARLSQRLERLKTTLPQEDPEIRRLQERLSQLRMPPDESPSMAAAPPQRRERRRALEYA
jgi:hypothetical protein